MHISEFMKRCERWNVAIPLLLAAAGICGADVRITEADAKAAAVVKPLPEYPMAARQLKITGKVEFEVDIDTDGAVKEVRIVAGNPALTRPCAKVLSAWKFKPILDHGKPAAAVAPISFEFK